jgi:hypothetical protein
VGDPEPCTGALELSCPRCGACSCPEDDQDDGGDDCPLHGPFGQHARTDLIRRVVARAAAAGILFRGAAEPPAPPLPLFEGAP